MIVLVTGGRDWTNEEAIERELRKLPSDTKIVHGGADGADFLAGKVALRLGMTVHVEEALWDEYGKAAGNIRNKKMLVEQQPDLVLAFHTNIDGKGVGRIAKGTKDMVELARKAKVPHLIFDR